MSLRARLLAASLVLVAAGLLVADVATYSALRSFLFDRVDQQLDAAQAGIERVQGSERGLEQLGAVAPRVFLQRFSADGTAGPYISGRGRFEQVYMPAVPTGAVAEAATLERPDPRERPGPGGPGPGGPGGPGGGAPPLS